MRSSRKGTNFSFVAVLWLGLGFVNLGCGSRESGGSNKTDVPASLLADPRVANLVSELPVLRRASISFDDKESFKTARKVDKDKRLLSLKTVETSGLTQTLTTLEYQPASATGAADEFNVKVVETVLWDAEGNKAKTTRDWQTKEGNNSAETTTYEYKETKFGSLLTKSTTNSTDSDGRKDLEVEEKVYGENGVPYWMASSSSETKNGVVTEIKSNSCKKLTCTESSQYLDTVSGKLVDSGKVKVITYFGAVGGLFERYETTEKGKTRVTQATFKNGRFSGYTLSGEEIGSVPFKYGDVLWKITGSCTFSDKSHLSCTEIKTGERDGIKLKYESTASITAWVLVWRGVGLVLPWPVEWTISYSENGSVVSKSSFKVETDSLGRTTRKETDLGSGPSVETKEYLDKTSSRALRETRLNKDGTVDSITTFTY